MVMLVTCSPACYNIVATFILQDQTMLQALVFIDIGIHYYGPNKQEASDFSTDIGFQRDSSM